MCFFLLKSTNTFTSSPHHCSHSHTVFNPGFSLTVIKITLMTPTMIMVIVFLDNVRVNILTFISRNRVEEEKNV